MEAQSFSEISGQIFTIWCENTEKNNKLEK
jgi:hypothetical protein